MKKILGLLSIIALPFAASVVLAAETSVVSKPQHADQHVILITLDGFPAGFWRNDSLPQ